MSADSQCIVVTTTLVVCCLVASITASSYDAQYPVCGKNEILSPTPVCCEPTCTNDCSTASFPENYVNKPVCVCKPGYVRHKSRCIRKFCCPKDVTSTESPPTSTTVFYPRYNEKPRSYGSCPCRRKPILPTATPFEPPMQPQIPFNPSFASNFVPEKHIPKPILSTATPFEPPIQPQIPFNPSFASKFVPEQHIPKQPSSYDTIYLPPPHISQTQSYETEPTPKPNIPQAYGAYPNLRPFIYNAEEKVISNSVESPDPEPYGYNPPKVYTTEPVAYQTTNPPYVRPSDGPITPEPTSEKTPEPVPEPTLYLPKPSAPKCDTLQTLTVCRPCCVPTCENDCSNASCTKICIAELNCICLAGYVLHEGKCIRREDCPAVEHPVEYPVEHPSEEGYRRTGYTPLEEFSAEQVAASDYCNDYPDM